MYVDKATGMSTKHRQTTRARLTLVGLAVVIVVAALAAETPETYYFFVFSNPVAGQEARYNKWYNEQHQLDVVSILGFVSAQRFVMNDLPLYRRADVELPKYLVVYNIVFTPFVDGKEDEFNTTYDKYHAPELAAIPGFTGAPGRTSASSPSST